MGKGKVAAPSREEKSKKVLSSVKSGSVVKASQTPKSKSKEMAKKAAAVMEHESKKSKKSNKAKAKEPSPSSSSSSESDDESMSDDSPPKKSKPVEKTPTKVVNGRGKASNKKYDTSSSSPSSESEPEPESESESESDSEVEKPKATATREAKDSSDDDSDSDSDSDSDEDDVPAAKNNTLVTKSTPAAMNGTAKGATAERKVQSSDDEDEDSDDDDDDDDSDDDSADAASSSSSDDESDSDESPDDHGKDVKDVKSAAPVVKKRAAEETRASPTKKVKGEQAVANGDEGVKNLFVGNLSWNVDEEWLSREFGEFGELTGVRIITDKQTGRSKGFGYVEFANADDAATALKAKNQSDLDGRALNVDFSVPRTNDAERPAARAKAYGDSISPESATLFVGNISFDATEDILGEEFGNWGTVTSVRLPTDMQTGAPKGFGYVEFSTVEEAKEALKNMNGASVAGRNIRCDFSTPRQNTGDSPRGGRGGRGGRGFFSDRGGGGGGRGGFRGGRGGFGDRGDRGGRGGRGRGGGRGASTNRGGFGDFKGEKKTFA